MYEDIMKIEKEKENGEIKISIKKDLLFDMFALHGDIGVDASINIMIECIKSEIENYVKNITKEEKDKRMKEILENVLGIKNNI